MSARRELAMLFALFLIASGLGALWALMTAWH
jgi:hypothetical protein